MENGSYDDLMANENGEVKRLLTETGRVGGANNTGNKKSKTEGTVETKVAEKKKDSLVTQEERMVGAVSLSVYKKYMQSGGGIGRFIFVFMGYTLFPYTTLFRSRKSVV